MTDPRCPNCLVLRLAGPLQSWGSASQFNRRETAAEPTKGGIVGLLAAAQGRRRTDPIEDLLTLRLAVRSDQLGSLLHDYHTVSDYRGVPLRSAAVNTKGVQKPAGDKRTHVTQRFYLQDAVFVAAVAGPHALLTDLAAALRRPAFPLALGRRACVPTQPLVLPPATEPTAAPNATVLWQGDLAQVIGLVPWQASATRITALKEARSLSAQVDLPVTIDDNDGDDLRADVPRSFAPGQHRFATRRVRNTWATVPTSFDDDTELVHDPFALLGW